MRDFFSKENINNLIFYSVLFFFISINIIYFYLNFYSLIEVENYAFNELFINYQSGFIRRGLLGEIAWKLNDIFFVDPRHFFSIFFLSVYLLQFYLFYLLFKSYVKLKFIFLFLFFSPSLLLFHIYSPELYFLRDGIIKLIILLHAYTFYYFVINKKNHDKYFYYLKFFIIPIIFLGVLIHQYQLFSISIHFLISLGALRKSDQVKKLIKVYGPLIISFILVVTFFGNIEQFENLSLILKKFDIDLNPHLGGGFLKYLGAFYKWHLFYFGYRDFLNLFASLILSLSVIYILFQYMIKNKILNLQSKFQRKYLIYFVPCFLPFFLTTDHGRNLSLLSFYLVSFYGTLNVNSKFLFNWNKKVQASLLNKFYLIIFLFFFIFLWKLNQFAGFGLQGKPNDIFQSSLFKEFSQFIKFLYNFIDLNVIDLPEIKL